MAYTQGDPILANHFNNFRDQINPHWSIGNGDIGYGQQALKSAIIGERVLSEEWYDFAEAVERMALLQGSTLPSTWPPKTEFEKGDFIIAFDGVIRSANPNGYNIQSGIDIVVANYLNIDPNNIQILTNQFSDSYSTPWEDSLSHEITVDFGTEDNARFFFNTGGSIRFNFSRSGGTVAPPLGPQNAAWTSFLNSIGTVQFGQNFTTNTGIGTGGIGYFGVDTIPQNIFFANDTISGGAYGVNEFIISARTNNLVGTNGGRGSTLIFTIQFLDNYSELFVPPPPVFQYSPYNNPIVIPDGIDGVWETVVDIAKTNFFSNIITPSISGSPYSAT